MIDYTPTDTRTMVNGYVQQYWLNEFFRNGGDDMLYKFDGFLNESSTVFDMGSYEGEFYKEIFRKYNCDIHAFEPVEQFYSNCLENLPKKVLLNNFALVNENTTFNISLSDNSSSQFISDNGNTTICNKVKFIDYINDKNIKNIDLIKVNIEGGEYELLDTILDSNYQNNIDGYLIQFHYLSGDPLIKRQQIVEKLQETHTSVFSYPFVWEYWRRK